MAIKDSGAPVPVKPFAKVPVLRGDGILNNEGLVSAKKFQTTKEQRNEERS